MAPDAERLVESLRQHRIEQVGSADWLEQQGWIEKLNVQSHHNARCHADEFVKDFLVSYDKVTLLVHELLLMEVWKERLLPHLKSHLAAHVDSVTTYLLVSHEANLANLLEITLFHEQALENIDEDYLVELVDWCHRKLQYLNGDAHDDASHEERTAKVCLLAMLQCNHSEASVHLPWVACNAYSQIQLHLEHPCKCVQARRLVLAAGKYVSSLHVAIVQSMQVCRSLWHAPSLKTLKSG